MPADSAAAPKSRSPLRRLRIIDLVRPHWKALAIAVIAVFGETLADILDPWPIKIVVDNILQGEDADRTRRAGGDPDVRPWAVCGV